MQLTSLKAKIVIGAGICLLLSASAIIGYAAYNMRSEARMAREAALASGAQQTGDYAKQLAQHIQVELNDAMGTARTLARALAATKMSVRSGDIDWSRIEGRYGPRLQHTLDLASSLLQPSLAAVKDGKLSEDEAKKLVIERIRDIRYDGGTGYLWINDMTEPIPKMVMHPTLPALEGKVLDDAKFNCAMEKKQNLFQAMVEVCKAKRNGFVNYIWPKPAKNGLTTPEPKLSYVRLVPEWNWVIGTGVYVSDADVSMTRADVNAMLQSLLKDNPGILAAYTDWEPGAFDGRDAEFAGKPGSDSTGRFTPYWIRVGDQIKLDKSEEYEAEKSKDYYRLPRETGKEVLIDPYLYPVEGKEVLMATVAAPIMANGKFCGIAAIDIEISTLQSPVDQLAGQIYGGKADVQVFGGTGAIVAANGKSAMAGKHMKELHHDWEAMMKLVTAAKPVVNRMDDEVESFAPVPIGQASNVWAVVITVPESQYGVAAAAQMKRATHAVWKMVGISTACAVAALVLLGVFAGVKSHVRSGGPSRC